MTLTPEAVRFARQSFRHPDIDKLLASNATFKASYDRVRDGIVRNVKTKPGGFVATPKCCSCCTLRL